MCNFLEYKGASSPLLESTAKSVGSKQSPLLRQIFSPTPDSKVVYRRYASLFFIAGCASTDNELITLEIVHRYVEQMDKYYGNVCELDIIFNFQKAYFILDELLLAGEMQESSKKNVLRIINQQDSLEDVEVSPYFPLSLICLDLPHLSFFFLFLGRGFPLSLCLFYVYFPPGDTTYQPTIHFGN